MSPHDVGKEGVSSRAQGQSMKMIAFPRSAVIEGCRGVGCQMSEVVVVVRRASVIAVSMMVLCREERDRQEG